MKVKAMISCGLRGRTNPVMYREMCEMAVKAVYAKFSPDVELEIIHCGEGPTHDVVDNFDGVRANRVAGLGKNIINELAQCDVAIFMDDWQNYDGCRCEHFIATQYEIPIRYIDLALIDITQN